MSAWLALVAVQLGPCCVRLVREARGDAVTDSRVTPQAAIEAGAAQLRATHWNGMGCGTHGTSACSRCYGPSPADATEVAEEVLAAAGPLLCQPLQDEIDRLTQQNEQFEGRISHLRELCGIDKFSSMEGFAPEVDRLRAIVDAVEKLVDTVERRMMATAKPAEIRAALAAVPVGTGNPTQPRADD